MPAHNVDILMSAIHWDSLLFAHNVDILMSAIHWDSLLFAHNVDILMSAIHWDSLLFAHNETTRTAYTTRQREQRTQRDNENSINNENSIHNETTRTAYTTRQREQHTQRDYENSTHNEDMLPLGQRLGTFHLFQCSLLFRFTQRGQSQGYENSLSTKAVCRLHMTRILQKSVRTALRPHQKRLFARIYHFSWRIN